MQSLRCTKRLLPALALCLTLNGCVVGAAVDLATTTVLTAGKLVVKGTGAVIDAAIPDGKKDKDKEKEKEKRRKRAKKSQNRKRSSIKKNPLTK